MMNDSENSFARLKRRFDRATPAGARGAGLFALGRSLDAQLGGGLARAALHEAVAQEAGDYPAACGFALMLAACSAREDGRILIVSVDRQTREQGQVYGPGLVELGIDPERIVAIQAPDELAALRVAADILGVFGLGAAIVDAGTATKLDLTASRKLLLAAEASGVTGIVLRSGQSGFASAASTRWAVSPAPSRALPGDAPGHTMLRLQLLRHRGGIAPFETLTEWNRDDKAFRDPALLRDLPAASERGQMAA